MLTNGQIIERYERDFERDEQQCSALHQSYRDDKNFFMLDKQWDDAEKADRQPKGKPPRPMITSNRARQFVMQVVNDHKQARMGIKVSPAGGEEDVELAQVRQGIIRAIEKNNGGRAAYNQAKEDQVGAGFGAWRLYADYLGPDSFEQEPKFLPIYDCTQLWWPILDCSEPDYSDMDNAIIREYYSKEKFKAKFKMDPESFLGIDSNRVGAWGRGQTPCVAEYYFREEIEDTLVRGIDGKPYFLSLLKKKIKKAEESGQQVISLDDFLAVDESTGKVIERDTVRCKVWWAKLAGKEVIGKPIELPGQYIPVFIANGRKTVIDGKVELWSLGRPARDSQKIYNYACSAELERLALAPKAPWLVADEAIPPTERLKWETLNTGNYPYVRYKAFDSKERPIPPPQRAQPIQSDPGFLNLKAGMIDSMKAEIGMYDASIGQKSNETSGRAIMARQREGDNATFDFADNMAITIRHCGRVLNEWIPVYIDTPRQVRMIGEDDAEKVIRVNQPGQDEKGKEYHYAMTEGRFDIDVDVGPSASTKRQETVESILQFYQADPSAAAVTGHLLAKEQDWRYKEEFSQILKAKASIQFPGIFQGQGQTPEQQQMQAQMQQMQQMGQQQAQELQAMKMDRSIDAAKLQLDREKLDLEWYKAQNEVAGKSQDLQAKVGMHHEDMAMEAVKIRQAGHEKHTEGEARMQMHGDNLRVKSAQQGQKPTGANPGSRPPGRKNG